MQDNVFFQDFSKSGHKQLPAVRRPKIVQSLNLSENQISETPDVSPLLNLKVLNLSGNMLTSLLGLGCLNRLENLDISKNSLKSLDGIEGLTSLKVFSASNNELRFLSGIQNLPNLQTLEVSRNLLRVDSFVELQLGYLKQLKFVDLSGNSISRVDSLCKALPRTLEVLLLDGNHIFTTSSLFPLGIFTTLRAIQLAENPCTEHNHISGRCMRAYMLFLLPSLVSLNNVPVTCASRNDAAKLFKTSAASVDWDDDSLSLLSNECE